ncbi:MAG: hypothetical protein QGG09_11070 [Pirellulaceae bacterium]|jgi:hypothetical protein|nr:hypothetical protein [Pirellulaceae bacterium]HJN11632.1 hypothetical protein [Pirellulaceae bacterium]
MHDEVGVPRKTIDDTCGEFGELANLAKSDKAAADHATDFDIPQQTKSNGTAHFGEWVNGGSAPAATSLLQIAATNRRASFSVISIEIG